MSVLMEFAMFPTDKGASVSGYVSRILDMIDNSGVSYTLTPMGTVVETDTVDQAMDVVKRAYAQLEADCGRVYSTIKLDIRPGKKDRLKGKIASVETKLQRKLK